MPSQSQIPGPELQQTHPDPFSSPRRLHKAPGTECEEQFHRKHQPNRRLGQSHCPGSLWQLPPGPHLAHAHLHTRLSSLPQPSKQPNRLPSQTQANHSHLSTQQHLHSQGKLFNVLT